MATVGTADIQYRAVGLRELKSDISSLESVFAASTAAVTAMAGAIGITGAAFTKTASSFEQLSVSLDSIAGSAAGGQESFKWIKQFAVDTPLELEQVTKGFIKMKNFGLDPTDGSFRAIVDTVAKFGGTAETMQGVVLALGQAWTKQKLQAEEANQLIERGVPVWDLLSKALGKTSAELMDLASKGKLGREEIALLLKVMGEDAAGASAKMMQTWSGMTSNLSDQWTFFQDLVMQSGVFDLMKEKLSETLAVVDQMAQSGQLQEWADRLSDAAESMLENFDPQAIAEWGDTAVTAMSAVMEVVVPLAKIIGVGGTMLLGIKALTAAQLLWSSALFKTVPAITAVTGSLGALSIAASGVFAAFAGWEIGSWLYDEFDEAKLAGLAFVSAMMRGWTEIQFAAEYAWSAIKQAFAAVMNPMLESMSAFAEAGAKAMDFLGKDEEAAGFSRIADDIHNAAKEMTNWAGTFDEISEKRAAAIEQHKKFVDEIANEATSRKKSADEARKAFDKIRDEREKSAKAEIKALESVTKAVKKETEKQTKEQEDAAKEQLKIIEDAAKKREKIEEKYRSDTEKALKENKKAFEKALKEEFGLKELSNESMLELDRHYRDQLRKVHEGSVEFFGESVDEMLLLKQRSIEDMADEDSEYGKIIRRESETWAENVRLGFYEEAGIMSDERYEKEKENIEEYIRQLEAADVDALEIEEHKNEQIQKLENERLRSSGSFFDGMQAALNESKTDFTNWSEHGANAADYLKTELEKTFSTSIDALITGDMQSLQDAWSGLWQSMLSTMSQYLGKMVAKWTAQKLAEGAGKLFSAISAEEGAFDVQMPANGMDAPGGGFWAILHPNETVLPEEWTDWLKDSTGYDEWGDKIRGYFGLPTSGEESVLTDIGDYSGAGASLWAAYQAYEAGNDTEMWKKIAEGFSKSLETYASQNASTAAGAAAGAASEAVGGVVSGIGAYQSFENEDWLGATVQALQAVEQMAAAYSAATAGTAGASTAGAAGGAAGGASGVTSYASGAISGAGTGMAAWNAIAGVGDIEHGAGSSAQIGSAIVGAIVGVITGSQLASAIGGFLGGSYGAIYDTSVEDEFDLSDIDPYINTHRTIQNGRISMLPPSTDTTWFAVTQDQYYNLLNTQSEAVNSIVDTAAAMLSEDDAQRFRQHVTIHLDRNIGNIESGGNYNRARADQSVIGVSSYWWNQTLDAVGQSLMQYGLPTDLSQYYTDQYINPLDKRQSVGADGRTWEEAAYRAPREPGSGAASGGVVVPSGEDGLLAVQTGEGIISRAGMAALDAINSGMRSSTILGDEYSKAISQRDSQIAELRQQTGYLSDCVNILADIARKELRITGEEITDMISGPLQSRANSGQIDLSTPELRRIESLVGRGQTAYRA